MSLTQDLRWSLERSIALQLQRRTDLLLCTVNCFKQWAHPQNMAVGDLAPDLAFYHTLYLCYLRPEYHWYSCLRCYEQGMTTHPDSSWLCRSHYVVALWLPWLLQIGSTLEGISRVLCNYCMHSSSCYSSCRVPSKAPQHIVATAVLCYQT